ncbi:MAG: DUF3108 domain-containing protein [Cyclobacteriaceae bacterium]|nr:DUF3108 domain-containing protein [Cyclobacteriaceae bacterium]
MKKYLLIVVVGFFNINSEAQCNQYFHVKKGTSWTLSNFNAKGKLQGKTIQKVSEYEESSNGFEAIFEITSVDKKGEQTLVGSSTLTCEGGVIYFDMSDMFPKEQMESMKDFDMTMKGTNVELPAELKKGQELKDANIVMSVSGPMTMNFKIDVTNRKVLGIETLNTPAGSFECFKISQDIYMKTIIKMEMRSIEWFSKDVGMVKSETYDKKNKLKSYTLLTTYNY